MYARVKSGARIILPAFLFYMTSNIWEIGRCFSPPNRVTQCKNPGLRPNLSQRFHSRWPSESGWSFNITYTMVLCLMATPTKCFNLSMFNSVEGSVLLNASYKCRGCRSDFSLNHLVLTKTVPVSNLHFSKFFPLCCINITWKIHFWHLWIIYESSTSWHVDYFLNP